MKCPKCNFTSFDYNDKCPRCGRDLTQEREFMGLPSYQPRPISMQTFTFGASFQQPPGPVEEPQAHSGDEAVGGVPGEVFEPLGGLPEDKPVPMQIEANPQQGGGGRQEGEEIPFEPDRLDYEAASGPTATGVPQPGAPSPSTSPETGFGGDHDESSALFAKEDDATKEGIAESFLDLEIEPLEFDLEMEEQSKN